MSLLRALMVAIATKYGFFNRSGFSAVRASGAYQRFFGPVKARRHAAMTRCRCAAVTRMDGASAFEQSWALAKD
jgi:hypothetical protein